MRVDVFTIFPDYFESPLRASLLGRARESGLLDVRLHDPRDFATGNHRSVDDTPFGGGAGMVMSPEPLFAAFEASAAPRPLVPAVGGRDGRSIRRPRATSRAAPASRCSAAGTKASTSGSPITCVTGSCRWATTSSRAARRPRSW